MCQARPGSRHTLRQPRQKFYVIYQIIVNNNKNALHSTNRFIHPRQRAQRPCRAPQTAREAPRDTRPLKTRWRASCEVKLFCVSC